MGYTEDSSSILAKCPPTGSAKLFNSSRQQRGRRSVHGASFASVVVYCQHRYHRLRCHRKNDPTAFIMIKRDVHTKKKTPKNLPCENKKNRVNHTIVADHIIYVPIQNMIIDIDDLYLEISEISKLCGIQKSSELIKFFIVIITKRYGVHSFIHFIIL